MSTQTPKPMGQEPLDSPDNRHSRNSGINDRSWESNLSLDIITNLADLEHLSAGWDRLLLNDPRPIPMSSIDWLIPYFSHRLHPDEKWACIAVHRGRRLVGIMPILYSHQRKLGRPYTIARAPYDSHTYGVDVLIDQQESPEVTRLLFQGLDRLCPNWAELQVVRLADTSRLVNSLPNGLATVGTIHEACDGESVLTTRGAYADFHRSLSRNFRRALKKAHKKLERLPNVRFHVASGSEIAEIWNTFVDIDAHSWRAEHGDDLKSHPSLARSHQKAVERLAAKDISRIYLMSVDGFPIAGQLAFDLGHTLAVKKVAHREEYSPYSPGNMLFEYLLKQAFENPKIEYVNCLTDMSWHRNWNMQVRPNRHLWIYRKRALPLLTGFLPLRIKQWLHYIPGLPNLVRWLRVWRA